jgi:hypothetical protein
MPCEKQNGYDHGNALPNKYQIDVYRTMLTLGMNIKLINVHEVVKTQLQV